MKLCEFCFSITEGGKNPSFNENITLHLIERLYEINILVCNNKTIKINELIGNIIYVMFNMITIIIREESFYFV